MVDKKDKITSSAKVEAKTVSKAPAKKKVAKKSAAKKAAKKTTTKKAAKKTAKKTTKKVAKKTPAKKTAAKETTTKTATETKTAVKTKKSDDSMVWKVLAIVLGLAIIIALIFVATGNSTNNASNNIVAQTGLDVTSDDSGIHEETIVFGAEEAPITIYVYSEYLCPYCQRFHQETEGKIIEKYVKTGYAKIVYKHFIVHEPARKLSMAALCAGEQSDEAFKTVNDALFKSENFQKVTDASLKAIIEGLDIDMDKYDACVAENKYDELINQDMADGRAIGVSGTPAISVNGNLIVGAQPFEVFDAAIQTIITGEEVTPESAAAQAVDTSNDPESEFIVIGDSTCVVCDTTQIVAVTKEQLFPKVKVTELDYATDARAKEILEETGIKVLPAYIFSKDVTESANFDKVAQAMVEAGDYLYINPGATGGALKLLEEVKVGSSVFKGEEDAPVTIVVFDDFECPFCKKFYEDAYQSIISEYVETGKVKYVYKHFPLSFHKNAQKASEASECARDQDKFWEMHDIIFENQDNIGVDALKSYAIDLGLDADKFNTCLDNGDKAQIVKDDLNYGSSVGVSGTPAFYINGVQVAGALPFENFKMIIDAELGEN